MMCITQNAFNSLKQAVLNAGQKIMEIYESGDIQSTIQWKEDQSPVTFADQAANDIIIATLKQVFPHDAILSEEIQDDLLRLHYSRCWILDPLDGTKEFIQQNDEFTVNLALSVDGDIVFGMVYSPVFKTLYWAQKNKGAFKQQEDNPAISICATTICQNIRVMVSRSHNHPQMDQILSRQKDKINDIIPMGSSLKGCWIAEGKAEIYIRHNPTMEWDTAAMHIIAVEAGAIFRQLDHTEMRYNRKNSLNEKGFYIINNQCNNFL